MAVALLLTAALLFGVVVAAGHHHGHAEDDGHCLICACAKAPSCLVEAAPLLRTPAFRQPLIPLPSSRLNSEPPLAASARAPPLRLL